MDDYLLIAAAILWGLCAVLACWLIASYRQREAQLEQEVSELRAIIYSGQSVAPVSQSDLKPELQLEQEG